MRDVIPLIGRLKEKNKYFPVLDLHPIVKFSVFEDNQICIVITKAPKMNPRAKHIAFPYHYFHILVINKIIDLSYVNTTEK